MSNIIWTPWRNYDELLNVRSQLYPANNGEQPDLRKRACSIISAWSLRRKLPHAVESTWVLTEAVLADENNNGLTPVVVRGNYSNALCRFVTGLADTEQDGAFKSSMYETAKQIGLPASFIDYRHDAIHGDLPSLIVFREATRKALEWLWKDYWKHLIVDTRTHGQGDRPLWNDQLETFKQQARLILQSYRSAASTITSPSQLQGSLNPVAPDAACLRLVKLCQSEKPALAELVNLLVEEDLLIPDSRRLGDAMDGIISMWNGLLKHLTFHQQLFLNLLTQKLITQIISLSLIDPKVDIDRETVHFWLLEIYTSREWTSARKRGKINANDLLTICLENPNLWTDSVASALINQPVCRKLGQIYKDRITASVTITAQATPHDSQAPKISEEKLADLLAYQQVWLEELEISRKEEKGAGSPNLAAGGWQKWSGEWIAKPFGTIQPSYLARRSLGPFLGSD